MKQYIRRNIYKWHRITSLIVALPILLWTVSGFLHPVMGMFKPEVKNQSLPVAAIDTSRIKVSLQDALIQNKIDRLHNFRIVKLYEIYYYQVQQAKQDTLTYINCNTGNVLIDGDRRYAAHLAQRFLSEPNGKGSGHGHHGMSMHFAAIGEIKENAGEKAPKKWKVTGTELVKKFDAEYKGSNKLLPVYKVSFEREDGIRLYVETLADRLALAVDDKKAWFTKFFAFTHSWSFMNSWGKGKSVLIGSLSLLCFLTSLFGFYIYNISNKKKIKKTNGAQANRYWHRLLGNVFMITTLLYAFSGAWHAFAKIPGKPKAVINGATTEFGANEVALELASLLPLLKKEEKLVNVSAVKMNDKAYWQLFVFDGKKVSKKYIDQNTLQELKDGDLLYGRYLACTFSGQQESAIKNSQQLTSFNNKYSMMNKRLPVIEVDFEQGPAYYVETSTGKLAAVVNESAKAERFSFSNLHMHHYWESWLGHTTGKSVKNVVLVASTLGLLIIALTGVMLWVRRRFNS